MFRLATLLLGIILLAAVPVSAARRPVATTYFSCTVLEPAKGRAKPVKVTVKFAVKGYSSWDKKGELLSYPGANEDSGAILVSPEKIGERYAMMTNLNGQGGDLRIEGSSLRLWGDGDGYQFTELVIWDADEEQEELEGYVRDYGPAYGDTETFKQFIKCRKSNKQL